MKFKNPFKKCAYNTLTVKSGIFSNSISVKVENHFLILSKRDLSMSAISNGLVINGVTYSLTNGDLAPQVIKLVESKIQSSVIKAIKIIGISFLVLFFYGKLVSVGPTKEPLSNQIPQYHPQVYIGNKAEDISSSEANDENFGLPKAPFTEKAD